MGGHREGGVLMVQKPMTEHSKDMEKEGLSKYQEKGLLPEPGAEPGAHLGPTGEACCLPITRWGQGQNCYQGKAPELVQGQEWRGGERGGTEHGIS